MTEVDFGSLNPLIRDIQGGTSSPVYLIHGDEYLSKKAFKGLLGVLVPEKERSLNYEPLDGAAVEAEEVVGRVNTFSLFPGAKVVAVHGTRVFYSKGNVEQLANKSAEAFGRGDLKVAASHFVNMLCLAGASLEDVSGDGLDGIVKLKSVSGILADQAQRSRWVAQVLEFCRQEQVSVPEGIGGDEVLNEAISAGFPEGHHLVLITDVVDRRKRLYKTIKRLGVIIDCSVPKGTRQADERARIALFKRQADKVLAAEGKKAAPGVIEAIYDKTGPSLRAFDSEINKLIAFAGEKTVIEQDDVKAAVDKLREDPIYALGNAVSERDISTALACVENLLTWDYHPLQILSAVINQIRKLILGRDLLGTCLGGEWDDRLDYRRFERSLLPKLKEWEGWGHVKNTHPYVLYRTLGLAKNFTHEELIPAFETLLSADRAIKSGGRQGRLILEGAVMKICGGYYSDLPQDARSSSRRSAAS